MTTEIAFQKTFNADSGGWNGYNGITIIPAGQMTAPSGTPTFIRLTLQAGAAQGMNITSAYIGHRANSGDIYDFATTPVQIKVGGNGSFNIPANGSLVSDDLAFVWDKTSDIVVAFFTNSATCTIRKTDTGGSGCLMYYKLSTDDTSTVNKSGYSPSSYNPGICGLVSKIEMDGYMATTPVYPTMFDVIGVIRNTGSGWFIINDAEHEPVNITSISTVNGNLTTGYVKITYPTASKVGAIAIVPDDSYAQSGYTAGGSEGYSETFIYFGKNGVAVSPDSVNNPSGNFWIVGRMRA